MAESKVLFNLKNCHYAKKTVSTGGVVTWATLVPIPGAVSISLSPDGEESTFYADDISYFVQTRKTVELHTDMKDPDSEAKLEGTFLSNNVAWEKSETKIDDEHCYLIKYVIEV